MRHRIAAAVVLAAAIATVPLGIASAHSTPREVTVPCYPEDACDAQYYGRAWHITRTP